jgi:hypothetical protein
MRRLVAFAFAAACGCTPMQWSKPDLSPAQFQADMNECRARAWNEASVRTWQHQSAMAPVFARDASGRGFFVWPSTPLADPYGYQMMEETRLTQFCMESKGYELVPAPKQ